MKHLLKRMLLRRVLCVITRSSWCQWWDLGCLQEALCWGLVAKKVLVTQRSWKAHNSRRRLPFSFCLPIPKCPMQRGYESCSAPKRALKSSRRFWIGLDYFIAPFRENSMCGSRCPPAAPVERSSFFFLFPVCKVSVWAGNHKFSSSVMSGSFKSMFGVLHRLDLGLTSHPNDAALPHE